MLPDECSTDRKCGMFVSLLRSYAEKNHGGFCQLQELRP